MGGTACRESGGWGACEGSRGGDRRGRGRRASELEVGGGGSRGGGGGGQEGRGGSRGRWKRRALSRVLMIIIFTSSKGLPTHAAQGANAAARVGAHKSRGSPECRVVRRSVLGRVVHLRTRAWRRVARLSYCRHTRTENKHKRENEASTRARPRARTRTSVACNASVRDGTLLCHSHLLRRTQAGRP